jgi:hypothetical protein
MCAFSQDTICRCSWCCACVYQYTFSYGSGTCVTCYPPAANNAITPAFTSGTSTYTWNCAAGYYATPVSRTCLANTDVNGVTQWSGSAINCVACTPPSAPTSGYSTQSSTDLSIVRALHLPFVHIFILISCMFAVAAWV